MTDQTPILGLDGRWVVPPPPRVILHIDFETRGTVELADVGVDNYSRHPDTGVWCMAFAFGDEDVGLLEPADFNTGWSDDTDRVLAHVAAGGLVVIHNAAFELAIWNNIMAPRHGWPALKPEQCRCTMAMAYAMALPGSLEMAAAAVGIQQQKDMVGRRLMLQMARPREIKPDGTIIWWDEPEKRRQLGEYCRQDVRVERELEKRLMPLSDAEQRLWVLDQQINNRGVFVDQPAVKAAIAVVQAEQDRLNARMREVTGNFVGFCTEVARIKKWLGTRGFNQDGLAKADVADLLERDDLPADVREALELRQRAGRSSTAKLTPMISAASTDGRLRGMFQYHGARTGRWAGRRVQLQNLPRPKLKPAEIEDVLDALVRMPTAEAARYIDLFYGSPMDVLPSCLRGLLTAAPGKHLITADFSNIEGRVLAWLAGEEWKLQAFRDFDAGTGADIYKLMAAKILHKTVAEITDEERQTFGKVPELACGYEGGVGAFQTMAKTYLVKIPDEQANEIKGLWRGEHPKTVSLWRDTERAAISAVLNPGKTFAAGAPGRQVKYKVKGSFLWCLLPSGRTLCYPYPKIMRLQMPWGDEKDSLTYMTEIDQSAGGRDKIIPDPDAHGRWQRISTYGGKLVENNDQAISRDLLAFAMETCHAAGYPTVLHAHDENAGEVDESFGDLKEFCAKCATIPDWAVGLPVVAAGWRGRRYRK
ncbi:MAG: hypothetical protein KG075_23855 [Alphaproteobacteria bacterium]|nr:hypothetical protein [Alphaproteobacteria bacterium]